MRRGEGKDSRCENCEKVTSEGILDVVASVLVSIWASGVHPYARPAEAGMLGSWGMSLPGPRKLSHGQARLGGIQIGSNPALCLLLASCASVILRSRCDLGFSQIMSSVQRAAGDGEPPITCTDEYLGTYPTYLPKALSRLDMSGVTGTVPYLKSSPLSIHACHDKATLVTESSPSAPRFTIHAL